MDEDTRAAGPPVTAEERSPEQIREDIDRTRRDLGDTVEALASKTDVKQRAHERVEEVKTDLKARTPDSAQGALAAVRSHPLPLAGAGALALAFWLGRRSALP
ncbi:MAG TPA: DUF3618 domain-containing protein [Solirubrobacter sp.]|nr:DUF3618 domain-containing protein [Solirubrobacter sp.]